MSDFKGNKYLPEVNKRNTWLNTIEDITVENCFINVSKRIHYEKTIARDEYDKRINGKLRKSSKHAENLKEESLYVGMLGELIVAYEYGVEDYWLKEQQKQIEKIKKHGVFDTTDIGRVQVRTAYHVGKLVSIIIRPGDFISKTGQPIIGCVYYPDTKIMKICGWITLEQVKENNTQYGSFGGDGTPCYYEAPYKLFPMSTFDKSFLS